MKLLIALPAYNEEKIIRTNVLKILDFCRKNFDEFQIAIADNGSTDRTSEIAEDLAREHLEIEYIFVKEKGKGRAIRTAWQKYEADIYLFCDIDLPANLKAIKTMVEYLGFKFSKDRAVASSICGGRTSSELERGRGRTSSEVGPQPYDIVVGSRYAPGAKMRRTVLRKLISLFYRLLLRTLFGLKVKDAACGIKAINKKVRDEIVPQVRNNGWFFDIELLILAQRQGYRILEVPVEWRDRKEPPGESVIKIIKIIFEDLREMIRLKLKTKNKK